MSTSEDRQARITDWLEEKRPDLASMYRAARELLASASEPGDERSRVSHICHSMREIMNRLPSALGIAGAASGGPRSSTHVRKLPALVARFPNLDLLQEVENVPVPRELAALLDELVRAAAAEDGRVAANVAALLTDDGNTNHPAVREWRDITDFFVKWAHLHDEQSDPESIPSDDDLRRWIDLAETLMDGIRAEFFDSLHAIEDLLAEANQLNGGGEVGG
ncbi:hypothetical protein [Neomicrococcus aestuarii]|uniref:Uncharacterized protein n=1 Tax=Neomicrococcus aestuarii TaxID=556325 RepID=A0A1L2ZPU6_9MICC|nr:hypothetical protein [Neomicrococcus aestuarii]APF41187.1 hypothetical protein BHE16_09480 [Neomicrococcus aestuarii]